MFFIIKRWRQQKLMLRCLSVQTRAFLYQEDGDGRNVPVTTWFLHCNKMAANIMITTCFSISEDGDGKNYYNTVYLMEQNGSRQNNRHVFLCNRKMETERIVTTWFLYCTKLAEN